ncbi:hypothetical protein [Curtobacterium sp. MCJR17_020]|uniref:hypothetical protein n=1 Tax=Curtobacterium sp. MCJR17_020 TaxID=2175619 RepID=UPI000DA80406|nr:hypothetical protein [Curtobacterium sp. MCJR17_020]WIE70949.1 hypothetical protein DEJ14_012145 [Curtobacterium sp. MCJR17_020]
MTTRLRRHTATLVLVGVAVVAAVVCAVAARGAGPVDPVSWWFRGADEHVVATKSQYESWLLALHVAEVAAVVAVVALLAAVVTAVVSSRRRRTRV